MATINSTNTYVTPTATGGYTRPAQPAFLAYVSTPIANVTGDGTLYTIVFDTERLDRGSDYNNATGVFTAPVTGRYMFHTAIYADGINSSLFTTSNGRFITTGSDYLLWQFNPFTISATSAPNIVIQNFSICLNLTAADTVQVGFLVGGGTKVVDIFGNSANSTFFAGYLIS